MPTGDMIRYMRGRYGGVPYHTALFPSAIIGGYGNPNSTSQMMSVDFDLSNALLTVTISGRRLRWRGLSWKVSFGKVTITREFRPQVIAGSGLGAQASVVFDVSKILRGKGTYQVKISCESAEPVKVESISLLGIMPLEGVQAEIGYWAGPLGLERGEEYVIDVGDVDEGEAQVALLATTPSRSTAIEVASGSGSVKLTGFIGTDVRHFRTVLGSPRIRIRYVGDESGYAPKMIYVNELVVYRPLSPGPVLKIREAAREDSGIRLKVVNEGSSPARNALLVGIAAGLPFYREVIPAIRPGEEIDFSLKLKEELQKPVIIRLVYYGVWGQSIETLRVD